MNNPTESPLFPIFDETGQSMVVETENGTPKIRLVSVTHQDGELISSIKDTEVAYMKLARDFDDQKSKDSSPIIRLNLVVNAIADATKRGAGNVVLMNSKTLENVKKSPLFSIAGGSEGETVGRWKLIGKLYKTISVYTNDAIDDDLAYILYRSSFIEGAGLIRTGEDLYFVSANTRDNPKRIASASDYIRVLRF